MRLEAYDNSVIYKGKAKAFYDAKLSKKEFQVGQKVMLFNSKVKLFPRKLKSRWLGPFIVTSVHPQGAVRFKAYPLRKFQSEWT